LDRWVQVAVHGHAMLAKDRLDSVTLPLLDAAEDHVLLRGQAHLRAQRLHDGAQGAAQAGLLGVGDTTVLDVEAQEPPAAVAALPAQVVFDPRPRRGARIAQLPRHLVLHALSEPAEP